MIKWDFENVFEIEFRKQHYSQPPSASTAKKGSERDPSFPGRTLVRLQLSGLRDGESVARSESGVIDDLLLERRDYGNISVSWCTVPFIFWKARVQSKLLFCFFEITVNYFTSVCVITNYYELNFCMLQKCTKFTKLLHTDIVRV